MRALFSVTDKTGLAPLAVALSQAGWELVATGGTAEHLSEAGLQVSEVSELTGYPAILDGRVKTLHPAVFGGILADIHNQTHLVDLENHNITAFDLVVCNLYAFGSNPGVENIDIGGPAMLRAAAKNHHCVVVVVDPADYDWVLAELLASKTVSLESRRRLAAKVFQVCAHYDAQIANWLNSPDEAAAQQLPETLGLVAEKTHNLRYGENPTQAAARYKLSTGPTGVGMLSASKQPADSWFDQAVLHNGSEATGGKGLSYLNLLDADAAWQLACVLNHSHSLPAAVAVKHTNPCGVALAEDLTSAWQRAYSCDPVSVFGGVVALSQPVNSELAELLVNIFLEVIVAPGFEAGALEIFRSKKNLRVLEVPSYALPSLDIRSAAGGLLVQAPARPKTQSQASWEVVTRRHPTSAEAADLAFAWDVVAATQSNAIVIAKDTQAIGVGAGQQNRKNAVELASKQAAEHSSSLLAGSVCASDAFFPFRDGLDAAAQAGCLAVIQPGGSVRDPEVITAADEHDMAMILTHQRCFRH